MTCKKRPCKNICTLFLWLVFARVYNNNVLELYYVLSVFTAAIEDFTMRVRFAPSPTGHLHIGGARTALFNYLMARKNGGTFILRIEDTDEERSTKASAQSIFESMEWLGLNWDEGAMPEGPEKGKDGPYVQSAREAIGLYKKYAEQLIAEGKAFKCYCTPEELEVSRKKALEEKRMPIYDGHCRHLTKEQQAEYERQGRKPVIRFAMPKDGATSWHDLIHKDLSFENKLLSDFVMVKASGYPTYNFACVVDDHLMSLTHVIRGDDHISNTPLQIQLYKALGWQCPEFAHLSMILGPDGARLSKRHGATSVGEYRKNGFLPETMRNYLALLGWSNHESQQIFKAGELETKFDLAGCQKSPAVFDTEKLKWLNGEYMRLRTPQELMSLAEPFIKEAGLDTSKGSKLLELITLEHDKFKLLTDIPHRLEFFYKDPVYEPEAIEKALKAPEVPAILSGIAELYNGLSQFNEAIIEAATRAWAKEHKLKNGQVFHPVRVAVSGRTDGPTLFKMLEYMGKDEVLRRLSKAQELI